MDGFYSRLSIKMIYMASASLLLNNIHLDKREYF